MSSAGRINLDITGMPRIREVFEGLASDRCFRHELWRTKPALLGPEPCISGLFELERDVVPMVERCELEAYRVTDVVCWNYDLISAGRSVQPPWLMAKAAMSEATIIFIGAGGVWPVLGEVCIAAQDEFGLPANINVYVSKQGLQVSAPAHTDSQDVFILQTQGKKHWQVFGPVWHPYLDPYSRGKIEDSLDSDQLGDPIIDTVLMPGDMLFIPAGFPHCTDTGLCDVDDEPSVHLTLGLDSFVWGVSMAQLRWGLLMRCGLEADWNPNEVERDVWECLQRPLAGFLFSDTDQEAAVDRLCIELPCLLKRMQDTAPIDTALVREVVSRFIKHHRQIIWINNQLYSNQDSSRAGVEAAMRNASIAHHMAIDGLIEFCTKGVQQEDPDHMDFYFAYNGS